MYIIKAFPRASKVVLYTMIALAGMKTLSGILSIGKAILALGEAINFLLGPIGLVIAIIIRIIYFWDDIKVAALWCWEKIKHVATL